MAHYLQEITTGDEIFSFGCTYLSGLKTVSSVWMDDATYKDVSGKMINLA